MSPGEEVEGTSLYEGAGQGAAVDRVAARRQHQVPLAAQDIPPTAVHTGAGQTLRIQVVFIIVIDSITRRYHEFQNNIVLLIFSLKLSSSNLLF